MFAQTLCYCFAPLFQKRSPAAQAKTAFLFVNFFFVPLASKKKWLKNVAVLS
jgi:hypothetical protein